MRLILFPVLLLAAACAPSTQPTDAQAREALTARLESSGKRAVKVVQIHALGLNDCRPEADGVLCSVAMDVSLEVDGVTVRSDDTGPMRFRREGGGWKAEAADAGPAGP